MVRVRIECNNHEDQECLYTMLKSCAKVIKVMMVIDSSGREWPGYFIEFEGEPSND